MITAGEVGAVFKIVDEASPVLKKLAEQFNALQATIEKTKAMLDTIKLPPGLNRSLTNFERNLKGINDQVVRTADTVSIAFGKIDTSIGTTAAAVSALKRDMASIGRSAGGAATAATAGGAERAAASRAERSALGVYAPLPGHLHYGAHDNATIGAFVGAGAVAYGTYEEAKIQDFINRIFLTGGISTGNQTANPLFTQIRNAILKTYTMTGLPLEQIEEGILTGTRGLAGIPLEKRLALMPGLLAASATEAYLKDGTTIPEAMQAFVGLAHMEGKYSPAEIARLADHFAFLSTTTPVSVQQLETAAGYAIPMLRTANFDPEQTLLMMTAMERAGIMNTKAGTWISQLAIQSFPGTSFMSKMAFKKHEQALKMLGLVDNADHPTWFTDGKPDLVKMTGIAADRIEHMDVATRLAVEKALWGSQGGRAGAFFTDPTNRNIMAAVAGEEKDFKSGEAMWKQSLENSPIVQFRTAFAGLNVELINLGSNVLPYVTGMLKVANQQLGSKGELAALGGGLLAYMASGWKGLRGGLIGAGVYAAGDSLLHWLIPDKPAQEAQLDDIHSLGPLRRAIGRAMAPAGKQYPDRFGWKPHDYLYRENLQGIGNVPSRAIAPNVTVNDSPKVTVNVTLDGKAIAAAVSTQIVKDNRVVTSSADHDGRAGFALPDGYNF